MMNKNYTNERNAQMLIYLLKAHGIKKVIVSPGATNVCLVASLQSDSFFQIYSSVDERSAAYIACGMAAESGEPVVLSCTGATASRNYVPGLTEAYYRKLPVLAVTSSREIYKIGHLEDQVTDRTCPMKDIAKISVQIPTIHTKEEEWAYGVEINKAILELTHRGGGPAHINLVTTYDWNYTTKEIAPVKIIERITYMDMFPEIKDRKVAIFIGSHRNWKSFEVERIDDFCENYNAFVLYDVTSNYRGKYGIPLGLMKYYTNSLKHIDILIHLGEISGIRPMLNVKEVWRVSPDGEIKDLFHKLTYVFEMEEQFFFTGYNKQKRDVIKSTVIFNEFKAQRTQILEKIPELPFSNAWVALHSIESLPKDSILHLGILNTLRSWAILDLPDTVRSYCNTGGYGIDGGVSSTIGASLVNEEKLYFGIFGDLAFFYDLNSLGNRHIGKNFRIMLINNGRGVEFRLQNNPASQFGEDTDKFISAAGHYGNKSRELVKHFAEDLGFEYMSASSAKEFIDNHIRFFTNEVLEKPLLFEVFVDYQDDVNAVNILNSLAVSVDDRAKNIAKSLLGEKGTHKVKGIINSVKKK